MIKSGMSHLPAQPEDGPSEDDNDFYFSQLEDRDKEYLEAGVGECPPCGFCGGRKKHNPDCVAHEWETVVPFGKHKGKPLSQVPLEYLAWMCNMDNLRSEFVRQLWDEVSRRDPTFIPALSKSSRVHIRDDFYDPMEE